MLEFSWRKTDKNNVPVMSAKEMDELAEMLIHDYKHALIKEPQPINYEHFLEVYLGVNLQYLDITADATILGMTAFDDGRVQVYDHELGREKSIDITKGSVILDNHLLASDKIGRLRFTALHEGGNRLTSASRSFDRGLVLPAICRTHLGVESTLEYGKHQLQPSRIPDNFLFDAYKAGVVYPCLCC